jgi:hypothetical protein
VKLTHLSQSFVMTTINSLFSAARALLFSFILLIASHFSGYGQQYFAENFNSSTPGPAFPTGWQAVLNGAPNTEWKVAASPFAKFTLTMNGNFAICDADAGGSGSETNSTLTSPAFNSSAANLLLLELSQAYRDYSATTTDSAIIEVFNGTSWIAVQKKTSSTAGNGVTPENISINITSFKNAAMRIRFRYVGEWPWFWAFDNVRVFQPAANDIGVVAVTSPIGDCGLSSATQIKVQVSNFGSSSQTSLPLSYRIGNGAPVSQTFSTVLAPGTSQEFTFSTTQNFSAMGDYFISAWTGLDGDLISANDSVKNIKVTKQGASFGVVSFSNYTGTNLSQISPGWNEGTGANAPAGNNDSRWRSAATVQQQYFGTQTAALNLYANTANEWIISPPFTPNAQSGLLFSACVTNWLNIDPDVMGSDDQVKVMVSTNCGGSWTDLKTFDRNSGLNFKLKPQSIPLAAFAGQEIRIAFYGTDGTVDDQEDYDFHLDSIRVVNLPPVELSAGVISSPQSGCGIDNPQVTLTIENLGTQPQTNFPVCIRINNGTPVCQNFTGTLAPGTSAAFTFTGLSQLANPGNYFLRVYTNVAGDANRSNDTTSVYSFQNLPIINTYPYSENFESGNGGWIPGGTFSSWALGTPAKIIIQGAAQGTNSYVTGGLGTGSYNSNEKSFVLGPCMNFSTLQSPVFEMKAWWASEFSEDGAVLQATTDDGTTWTTIGNFEEITNWYNDNTIEGLATLIPGSNPTSRVGWSGGLNDGFGSNGWVTVRNDLTGLGGKPNVKLRIAFGSGNTVAGDGFAFDALRIYEKLGTDVAFSKLVSPQISGCGLTDTTRFRIQVKNVGSNPITTLTVGYRITGRPTVQQTIPVNIPSSQLYTHVFSNVEAMGQIATYKVQAWAKIPTDNFSGNDSTRVYDIEKRGAFDDTVRFNGFVTTGTNLPILFPGWSVSSGNPLPASTTSLWRASQANQTTFYGKTVARINMALANRREWILSPAYRIPNNAFLNFEVATVDAFATTNDPSGGLNGTDDRLRIMISQDCGSSWQEIFAVKDGDGVNNVFKNFKVNLVAYAGKEVRIAFWATTFPVSNANDYDLLLDKIFIETLAPKDVGVTSISSPSVSCGLGTSVPISITIRNFGSNPLTNIPVGYQINQNPVVTALIPGPLAPQTNLNYTFTQTADLSLSQPYEIKTFTALADDSVITNDQFTSLLTRFTAPLPPQSLAGFNGSNLSTVWNGWSEARGLSAVPGNSSWTNGTVAGNNSLKVKLANASKTDWVLSPGIRINNQNFLRFKAGQFSVNGTGSANFDIDDSITVLISTNCGSSWKKIFKIGPGMSPVLNNTMQEYSINLSAFTNQEVRFGFRARDGVRKDDSSDVYINDIEISSTLTQDAGPFQISFSPAIVSNTFLKDSTYQVSVRINNFGTQPISSVPVAMRFANGSLLSQTISGPIAPGQGATVVLGNFIPTALGVNLQAWLYTALPSDQATTNDTLNFTYNVTQPVAQTRDAGPLEVTFIPARPLAGFSLDSTYQVYVKVSNFGSQLLNSIPISANFPVNPLLNQTISTPLPSTQIANIYMGTFTPNATGNGFVAKIYTSLAGDQVITNDTLLYSYPVVVSAKEQLFQNKLAIFPNPARSEVHIAGLQQHQKVEISLINLLGKKVISAGNGILSGNSRILRWNLLPAGIYRVEILEEGRRSVLPLVIQ